MKIVETIIFVGFIFITGILVYNAYTNDYTVQTIELNKEDWVCNKTETTLTQYPMLIGNIIMIQNIPSTECVEYTKK